MTAPYATDYTAIVHHRDRMATANDINLSGLPGGGLDMPAAGWGLGTAGVVGLVLVPIWLLFLPGSAWFAAAPLLLVAVIVYWAAQRDTEGRETALQRIQLLVMQLVKQPDQIAGMAGDTEPTHFRWEVIVARAPGADGPALPVRQYEDYGYLDDEPAQPVQGRAWPGMGESVPQWQRRVWWESGGELLDSLYPDEEGDAA